MIRIRRRVQEIPMASMSDIAFLLIVFFIVTMSFVYKRGLVMALPKKNSSPVIVNVKDTLLLKLDAKGNLYLNDKKILMSALKFGRERASIIKVEPGCRYKHVVALIDLLQKNSVYKISVKQL